MIRFTIVAEGESPEWIRDGFDAFQRVADAGFRDSSGLVRMTFFSASKYCQLSVSSPQGPSSEITRPRRSYL